MLQAQVVSELMENFQDYRTCIFPMSHFHSIATQIVLLCFVYGTPTMIPRLIRIFYQGSARTYDHKDGHSGNVKEHVNNNG